MNPTTPLVLPSNTHVCAFRKRCARLSQALGIEDVHLLADIGRARVDAMVFQARLPGDPQAQGLQLRFDLDGRPAWTPRVDPVDTASLLGIDPQLAGSIELSPDGTQVHLVAFLPDPLHEQPAALADAVRAHAQTARALALQVAFITDMAEKEPD